MIRTMSVSNFTSSSRWECGPTSCRFGVSIEIKSTTPLFFLVFRCFYFFWILALSLFWMASRQQSGYSKHSIQIKTIAYSLDHMWNSDKFTNYDRFLCNLAVNLRQSVAICSFTIALKLEKQNAAGQLLCWIFYREGRNIEKIANLKKFDVKSKENSFF